MPERLLSSSYVQLSEVEFDDGVVESLVARIAVPPVSDICINVCRVEDEAWIAIACAIGACGRRLFLSLEEQEMPGTRGLLALADAVRANPMFTIANDWSDSTVREAAGIVAIVRAFAERGNTRANCGCYSDLEREKRRAHQRILVPRDPEWKCDKRNAWCGAGLDFTCFHNTPEVFVAVAAEVARARAKRVYLHIPPGDDNYATAAAATARMIRESSALHTVRAKPEFHEGLGDGYFPEAAATMITDAAAATRLPLNLSLYYGGAETSKIVYRARGRGNAYRAIVQLLLAVAPSPRGRESPARRFIHKDGDNACAHRVLRFLVG